MKPASLFSGNVPVIGEHRALVGLPIRAIEDLLKHPDAALHCPSGVPADAELVGFNVQAGREPAPGMPGQDSLLILVFKHPSFPPPLADGTIASLLVHINLNSYVAPAAPEEPETPGLEIVQ